MSLDQFMLFLNLSVAFYLKMVLMLVWVLVPFRALSINTRYVSSDRLSAMAWQ